jgi:tetratricopeptide (TPR) repeat protein
MGVAVAVLAAACARKKPMVDHSHDPAAAPLKERLSRLEILYDVLQKDAPPPRETHQFRQWQQQAPQLLKEGKFAEAESIIMLAEAWMEEARPKYYHDHVTRVMAGRSPETAAGLMNDATNLAQTGQDQLGLNNAWAAEQYFAAAIEQSELALLAAQRSPEQAPELFALAGRMERIYLAAGRPEQAGASKERVLKVIDGIVSRLDQEIRDCLRQKTPECERDKLLEKEENYQAQEEKMRRHNELRNRICAAALNYAPDRFRLYDFSPHIAQFHKRWFDHWHPGFNPEVKKP